VTTTCLAGRRTRRQARFAARTNRASPAGSTTKTQGTAQPTPSFRRRESPLAARQGHRSSNVRGPRHVHARRPIRRGRLRIPMRTCVDFATCMPELVPELVRECARFRSGADPRAKELGVAPTRGNLRGSAWLLCRAVALGFADPDAGCDLSQRLATMRDRLRPCLLPPRRPERVFPRAVKVKMSNYDRKLPRTSSSRSRAT
jgi:hypothetical protein